MHGPRRRREAALSQALNHGDIVSVPCHQRKLVALRVHQLKGVRDHLGAMEVSIYFLCLSCSGRTRQPRNLGTRQPAKANRLGADENRRAPLDQRRFSFRRQTGTSVQNRPCSCSRRCSCPGRSVSGARLLLTAATCIPSIQTFELFTYRKFRILSLSILRIGVVTSRKKKKPMGLPQL